MNIQALFLICVNGISASNLLSVKFVASFVENEGKPTQVVYNLCWNSQLKLIMAKELSKSGVRASSTTDPEGNMLLDHMKLFLIDLQCTETEDFVAKAIKKNLFQAPYRWLALSRSSDRIPSYFWNTPLFYDSDFVLAENIGEEFVLTELHRYSLKTPMITTHRGFFNGILHDVRPYREHYRRRKDLMGQDLTVSITIQDGKESEHHIINETRLGAGNDSFSKALWSVMRLSFEKVNATPRYIFSQRFGYKVNGTWSAGMINDLLQGRADVGTYCTITQERLEEVSYTNLAFHLDVGFIFRQPPLSYVSNIYAMPFSIGVWFAVLVCSMASTAALYLASKHEDRFEQGPNKLNGNIFNALFLTVGAIAQQGCVMGPSRLSGRIILIIFLTSLMALYAAYSANIVVLLQAPSSSIKNLAQLADSKMTLAAVDVDYNHFVFTLYNDPVRLKIGKKIEPEKGPKNYFQITEGIERIREGIFALHGIGDQVFRIIDKTFTEPEKCDLMFIDYLDSFPFMLPMKNDSPFLEIFKVTFKQILESGIQQVNRNRHVLDKPKCSNIASFSSVDLWGVKPVILLMLIGILISIGILLIEIFVSKLSARRIFLKK